MAEVAKITKRGTKEASEEAKVKAAAARAATKAAGYVSSTGTSSAVTAASTTMYTFTRAPTSTSSVVGIAIRSGYTLIIIMLYVLIQELDISGLALNVRPGKKR